MLERMMLHQRRRNRFCTFILVTCIFCTFMLLLGTPEQGQYNALSNYMSANAARSVRLSSASFIPYAYGAMNKTRPFIDYKTHKSKPVIDITGFMVEENVKVEEKAPEIVLKTEDLNFIKFDVKSSLKGVSEEKGKDLEGARNVKRELAQISEISPDPALLALKKKEQKKKQNQFVHDIDVLDSKIVQTLGVGGAPQKPASLDDVNLKDDFLQIHKAIKPPPKKDSPVQLIILTNRRCGSSFLGQVFNQNPKVFFHFEPLKFVERNKDIMSNTTVFLRTLLKCKLKKIPYYMQFLNKESLHRFSSKALTTHPLCTFHGSITLKNVKNCGVLNPEVTSLVCSQHPHSVAKLIRLDSLQKLERVLRDSSLNVKVIHLVRDPRGVYVSRSKVPSENKPLALGKVLDGDVSYLCKRMQNNLDFAHKKPNWLKDKYKVLRYEDLASDPERWTKELYDFGGLGQVPSEVMSWIRTNTNSNKNVKDSYSTSRNSKEAAEAWRDIIPLPVAQRIQELCQGVLSKLHYREIQTEADLRNRTLSILSSL